ncbi:MAG: 50S ribosomal protein L33 [Tidjanibacter sp.]|nr:50S ribosomal protein L33 [Tidjanibacter sp.]
MDHKRHVFCNRLHCSQAYDTAKMRKNISEDLDFRKYCRILRKIIRNL